MRSGRRIAQGVLLDPIFTESHETVEINTVFVAEVSIDRVALCRFTLAGWDTKVGLCNSIF